ncbi:MAG: hypothetical protein HRU12_21705, partial [Phaeodactylibacter sp.]|nr:hypothetical protein [Phaeodactylibacter sp.]
MTIAEIKRTLRITTVLDHFGWQYDKKGRMCCPFHDDRKPSMQVYFETDTVYCFSGNCRVHGKALDVIAVCIEGMKGDKAAGIRLARQLAGTDTVRLEGVTRSGGNPTKQVVCAEEVRAAFKVFQRSMLSSKLPKQYLEGRGLQWEGQEVGYHPYKHRKAAFLSGCVVWPLKNESGEIVSLYGRKIQGSQGRHYYLSGRQGLFPGHPKAGTRKLILTECIIDGVTLLQQASISKEYEVLSLYGEGWSDEHTTA